jgi:hypothetical protein
MRKLRLQVRNKTFRISVPFVERTETVMIPVFFYEHPEIGAAAADSSGDCQGKAVVARLGNGNSDG